MSITIIIATLTAVLLIPIITIYLITELAIYNRDSL
jgi:hypothetical protein